MTPSAGLHLIRVARLGLLGQRLTVSRQMTGAMWRSQQLHKTLGPMRKV